MALLQHLFGLYLEAAPRVMLGLVMAGLLKAWLPVGMFLATLVTTYLPPDTLVRWGSGRPAMLMLLVVGIPMSICDPASTPWPRP